MSESESELRVVPRAPGEGLPVNLPYTFDDLHRSTVSRRLLNADHPERDLLTAAARVFGRVVLYAGTPMLGRELASLVVACDLVASRHGLCLGDAVRRANGQELAREEGGA